MSRAKTSGMSVNANLQSTKNQSCGIAGWESLRKILVPEAGFEPCVCQPFLEFQTAVGSLVAPWISSLRVIIKGHLVKESDQIL